jgi:hypothetical protein
MFWISGRLRFNVRSNVRFKVVVRSRVMVGFMVRLGLGLGFDGVKPIGKNRF